MRIVGWCLVLLFAFSVAEAQSITTGAVRGVVKDAQSGEPLAGVTVTIGSQVAFTDENGEYKITELLPGTYDVELSFETTKLVRRGVVVSANFTITVNTRLKIGEAVFVDGSPPPINILRNEKETRIGRKEIESLPTGDTFESATRQVPGTQNDGVGIAV